MQSIENNSPRRTPWNKGKLVGQRAPLKLREIWAIRIRLQLAERTRELALFNLAVDSKLRSCDFVRLRVRDVTHGDQVANRAIVMQQKTGGPVQFEITEQTRESLAAWIRCPSRRPGEYLFPSRLAESPHLSTRQYARIVRSWVREITPHQSVADPSQDQESQGGAVAPWAFEAREHGAISRHGGR